MSTCLNQHLQQVEVFDSSVVFDLMDRVVELNATEGLILINEVANNGVDLVTFIKEMQVN